MPDRPAARARREPVPPRMRCGHYPSRGGCEECQPRLHPAFPCVRTVYFSTMAWAVPGGDDQWEQRYGTAESVIARRLMVASHLSCWERIVEMTRREREDVVRVLKWAQDVEVWRAHAAEAAPDKE